MCKSYHWFQMSVEIQLQVEFMILLITCERIIVLLDFLILHQTIII